MRSFGRLKEFLEAYKSTESISLVGPMPFHTPLSQNIRVYVDGGLTHLETNMPYFSVGDGDSSSLSPQETLPPNKDYSDLSYVFQQLTENFQTIEMFGFIGGRKDHEFINLHETINYLKSRTSPCKINLENKILAFSRGKWTFQHSGIFSLVATQNHSLSVEGDVCYKSANIKAFSSHGLSNEAFGFVSIEAIAPCLVFLNTTSDFI